MSEVPDQPIAPVSFGTDGLRGHAGQPPLDAPTLRRIGSALGVWLETLGRVDKRILLGNDGRESAGWIGEALSQGLGAADAHCVDIGLCTTPALAYVVGTKSCAAGIMISASHNPPEDNGIKIFGPKGTKLPELAEREIERLAGVTAPLGLGSGRNQPRREYVDHYVEHLANTFPELDLTGLKIVVDAANGGGSKLAPIVLRGFGAEVVEMECSPDGTNINRNAGALHPERLAARVLQERAVLGLALDGDGDRGIFVDETGAVRDGDAVLAALALALDAKGRLAKRTVVGTVMSNLGLKILLLERGIGLIQTAVGDKHVVGAMREGGFDLGGEQSGHIVFGGVGRFTGDGIFTALQLLSLPEARKSGFAALLGQMRRFPQVLVNVRVGSKPPLESLPEVQAAASAVERALATRGRVLLRYSGTEMLCRVMVEGEHEGEVRSAAESIARAVRQVLPG